MREYFLFDPLEEYLDPPLQGFHLKRGRYVRIKADSGRSPSEVLGLHLERDGSDLRLYNPRTTAWERTSEEIADALRESEAALRHEEAARRQAQGEIEQLRREVDRLRRELKEGQ